VSRAGRLVLWSCAEGARGRRWREVAMRGAARAVARSITLETGPDRRPSRFECATGRGLLTLHHEADGHVHGNLVTAHGVRPIDVGAGEVPLFDLPESPVLAAALCWALEPEIALGERRELLVVRLEVGDESERAGAGVGTQDLAVERAAAGEWHLGGSGLEPRRVILDADGLPLPEPAERWSLEPEDPPRDR
jgi:hypothetical protein